MRTTPVTTDGPEEQLLRSVGVRQARDENEEDRAGEYALLARNR